MSNLPARILPCTFNHLIKGALFFSWVLLGFELTTYGANTFVGNVGFKIFDGGALFVNTNLLKTDGWAKKLDFVEQRPPPFKIDVGKK